MGPVGSGCPIHSIFDLDCGMAVRDSLGCSKIAVAKGKSVVRNGYVVLPKEWDNWKDRDDKGPEPRLVLFLVEDTGSFIQLACFARDGSGAHCW